MKTIYEHTVGGDGALAGVYVDDQFIYETVKYPLAKALEAPDQFIDKSIDGLESKLGWAKALLEPVRVSAKAALAKLIGG